MTLRRANAFASLAVLTCAATLVADEPRIVIDGAFEDWLGPIPAAEDPFEDSTGELDLARLAIIHDEDAVYLDLEFADMLLAQGLDGMATLLFDADGDRGTGDTQLGMPGVDAAILFSPPEQDWTSGSRGITARSIGTPGKAAGEALSAYDLGIIVGPTHASNRFEIRLERGLTLPGTGELFRSDSFSVAFVSLDPGGEVEERSDVLTYEFGEPAGSSAGDEASPDPLARAEGTDLRVLSWNVSAGAIIDRVDVFRRILTAIQPDIVLFDEAPSDIRPATLLNGLAGLPSPDNRPWNAAVSSGGGRQHLVVMSHFPVTPAPGLERIAYPDDFPAYVATIGRQWIQEDLVNAATDGVSAAGFLVDLGERRMLAVPLDLQCCGRLEEPEDRIREIQAQAIHSAIASALPKLDVDGVIVAGDFNLVGSRKPLNILRGSLDVDGSDLTALDAIQLDGRSAATWGFSGRFPTSRLDYLLYSDSELMPLNAFVFDARDLSTLWLEIYRLTPQDAVVSGHLPIVVDLRWAYPPAER